MCAVQIKTIRPCCEILDLVMPVVEDKLVRTLTATQSVVVRAACQQVCAVLSVQEIITCSTA